MHSQDLFTALFNTNPADPTSRRLLESTLKKYPYFSAAHFFLLKNTDADDENYSRIAAKTSIHFENPFLLNYKIRQVEDKVQVQQVEPIEKIDQPKKNEPVAEWVNAVEPMKEVVNIEQVNNVEKTEPSEEMIFEPLFATDYFASQGIKLSEEVQTGDKLGKQLKSFTEWLKTMKKVHESKLPPGNEQTDIAVQKLAEKSNEEGDVLTESMAEAYLQQGKAKKAREIFEKLSLFNPNKSAYFAAKIESITGS